MPADYPSPKTPTLHRQKSTARLPEHPPEQPQTKTVFRPLRKTRQNTPGSPFPFPAPTRACCSPEGAAAHPDLPPWVPPVRTGSD
eukprot:10287782-Alexandrium_andersonii.AAC.1